MKQSPRDTYKYELYDKKELVYVGKTNDLARREKEHRRDGKVFTRMEKVGRITTDKAAHTWEGKRLDAYKKSHKGKLPKHSISQLGDKI